MFIHKRVSIGQAYADCIKSDKFSFAAFSLSFSLGKLDFRERQALFLLSRMMENGNRENPTPEKTDIALSMLYDAEISFSFTESKDEIIFHAEADFADTPALGNDIFERMLDYIRKTILFPFPEGEECDSLILRTSDELYGDNSSIKADPDAYSYYAYKDALYSADKEKLSFAGIREIPEIIGKEDLIKIHEKIAAAPLAYAFYIGRRDAEDFSSALSCFKSKSDVKILPLTPCTASFVSREGPLGTSTRIYLAFSYTCKDYEAGIFASYLGGVPVSRLFTVLREENRFCYSTFAEKTSGCIITASATVGTRIEEKVRGKMLEVIEECKSKVDKNAFEAAKQASLMSLKYAYENRRACERFFFSSFAKRENPNIESVAEKIKAFTEEDLMRVARCLTPVIDFTLFGEKSRRPDG